VLRWADASARLGFEHELLKASSFQLGDLAESPLFVLTARTRPRGKALGLAPGFGSRLWLLEHCIALFSSLPIIPTTICNPRSVHAPSGTVSPITALAVIDVCVTSRMLIVKRALCPHSSSQLKTTF
jgi:hypothetical protein